MSKFISVVKFKVKTEDENNFIESMQKFNYDMIVGKRVHKDTQAYRKGHIIGNKFFSNTRK